MDIKYKSISTAKAAPLIGAMVLGLRDGNSKTMKRITAFLDRRLVIRVTRRCKGEDKRDFSCVLSLSRPNSREFDYINRGLKDGKKLPFEILKFGFYKKVKHG